MAIWIEVVFVIVVFVLVVILGLAPIFSNAFTFLTSLPAAASCNSVVPSRLRSSEQKVDEIITLGDVFLTN